MIFLNLFTIYFLTNEMRHFNSSTTISRICKKFHSLVEEKKNILSHDLSLYN